MALIKLLLFDDDDEYSSSLCNFLTHNYSETFLVNYFNNTFNIQEWIEKCDPDIILTSEKYYSLLSEKFRGISILLTAGRNHIELSNITSIYKYKDVTQIAGEIVDIFTKSGQIIRTTNGKATKLAVVYSAAGNVGKTSISLGISSISSYSGLSIFYLNLEQFQSTHNYLKNTGEYSFSDILYYAKEKDENLYRKIPLMSSKDATSNIHYFNSPDNVFEINEITPQDISFIIEALKECGQYDLIVMDMDSRLSDNSLKVFEMADDILYVYVDEKICLHKTKLFLDNLSMLSNSKDRSDMMIQKLLFVENKVSKQVLHSEKFLSEYIILSRIPFCKSTPLANPAFIPGGPEIIGLAYKNIIRRYTSSTYKDYREENHESAIDSRYKNGSQPENRFEKRSFR